MRKIKKCRKVGEKMYTAVKKEIEEDIVFTEEQIEYIKASLARADEEIKSGSKGYTPEEVYEYINKKINKYIKEQSNEKI